MLILPRDCQSCDKEALTGKDKPGLPKFRRLRMIDRVPCSLIGLAALPHIESWKTPANYIPGELGLIHTAHETLCRSRSVDISSFDKSAMLEKQPVLLLRFWQSRL